MAHGHAIKRAGDGFTCRRYNGDGRARSWRMAEQAPAAASAPTSCCGRSCRTRCSRRSVTWPVRARWPTSGQLGGVYQEFGIPMPLIYARATATLVDSAAARFLRRIHRRPRRAPAAGRIGAEPLLQSQLPAVGRAGDAGRSGCSAAQHDAGGRGAAGSSIRRSPAPRRRRSAGWSTTCRRCTPRSSTRRRSGDETLRRQFIRAQAQIFPLGHPQERTLSVVYFLNQYGPALVDRLLDELPLEMGQHWVLTI